MVENKQLFEEAHQQLIDDVGLSIEANAAKTYLSLLINRCRELIFLKWQQSQENEWSELRAQMRVIEMFEQFMRYDLSHDLAGDIEKRQKDPQ